MAKTVLIGNSDIRIDKDTGFICITDIGNVKEEGGGQEYVRNWMRSANTIGFILAWEGKHNGNFKPVDFDRFEKSAGLNSFRVSAGELIKAGATGITTKRGRYGGTYCHIDWVIHFADWLDPRFYVETIDAYRRMTDQLYGRDASHQRFARLQVASNYKLITEANAKRDIKKFTKARTSSKKAGESRQLTVRHLNQVDADIINLAIWKTTAQQWRDDHPDYAKGGKNMRDHCSNLELEMLNQLQIIMRHLQEDQYTAEEKLDRLSRKARELRRFLAKDMKFAQQHIIYTADRPW